MSVRIRAIAHHLPARVVTNDELAVAHPGWNMKLVSERAGVFSRHLAAEGETAFDLALEACRKLFTAHPEARAAVDAIIFCTQTGDYVMPPNSCLLHRALELGDAVFATDINLACSGYIYGLALAQGLVAAGTAKNVLLVTADTYSRLIHPEDRSARVLFGDAAAVSWIASAHEGEGVLALSCHTAGKDYAKFYVPAGGMRVPRSEKTRAVETYGANSARSLENIHMDGMGVLAFVNSVMPKHVLAFLDKHETRIEDVDLFIFHQASKMALEALTRALKLPPGKVFSNLPRLGNTVSASIPIALEEALATGALKPGQRALLCGFGVGMSWGSVLIRA